MLKSGCIYFFKIVAYTINQNVKGKINFDEKECFCKKCLFNREFLLINEYGLRMDLEIYFRGILNEQI